MLWIRFMIKTLITNHVIFFKVIWHYIIQNALLKRYYTTTIKFGDITLFGPNEHWFFYTAIEVFQRKLYKKLIWCNHILDLWWYLWESAVRFSKYNQKVTVVEANKSNYDYILKNTDWYSSIVPIYGAITHKNKTALYYEWNNYSAGWKVTTVVTDTKIPTIAIQDVFSADIDGIKIDIEWWEYDIIEYLTTNISKQIKKWYIEFHHIQENVEIIITFLSKLDNDKYSLQYEDIYWHNISKDIFLHATIAVVYFEIK